MNAADVVGWAYEAALHCPRCTVLRFPHIADEEAWDNEGNAVQPVFCGEDSHGEFCDTCGESLD